MVGRIEALVSQKGRDVGVPSFAWWLSRKVISAYLDYLSNDTIKHRYRAQLDFLEPNHDAVLLDIGCHAGANSKRLGAAIGTSRLIGLEYSLIYAQQARKSGIRSVVADANAPLPLATGSVDVVTAMDLFEHLVNPRSLVRETYRVLRPGGYAVFFTPNLASWHNIFALFLGLQPFSGPNLTSMLDADLEVVETLHRRTCARYFPESSAADERQAVESFRHIVVPAYRSMVRLFRREGFEVERAIGFDYYPLPPAIARLFARIDPWHSHHILLKARKPRLGVVASTSQLHSAW